MCRGRIGSIVNVGRYTGNISISSYGNFIVVIVNMTYFNMSIIHWKHLWSGWRVKETSAFYHPSQVLDTLPSKSLQFLCLKQPTRGFPSTGILRKSQRGIPKHSCSSYFGCASPLLMVYSTLKNSLNLTR